MADKPRYSEAQIREGLRYRHSKFHSFMDEFKNSTSDAKFYYYVNNLLFRIYELHLDGKFMTKTNACRMIPLANANACQKYVEEAQKRGFIKIEDSVDDKRKKIIVPNADLIEYVENNISDDLNTIRDVFLSLARHGIPKDNMAMSGYTLDDRKRR